MLVSCRVPPLSVGEEEGGRYPALGRVSPLPGCVSGKDGGGEDRWRRGEMREGGEGRGWGWAEEGERRGVAGGRGEEGALYPAAPV